MGEPGENNATAGEEASAAGVKANSGDRAKPGERMDLLWG
jgi:hypothetical protein